MQLQIKVYSNVNALESNNRLFERIIEVNDSVHIPFEALVSNFKFLYGQSVIVSFNVM